MTFSDTLNSSGANRTLAVNTNGTTTFSGDVGGTLALTTLTTDLPGSVSLRNVTTTGAQTYNENTVTLNGTYTTTNSAVTAGTTSAAITLGSDTTVSTGSGNITFNGTVNGTQSLTANSTGITLFAGAVGNSTALTSLTTNAGGTTRINGGSVRTTGAQNYNDAVTLGAHTILTGTTPTFGSTVTGGGFNLALNFSGTTTINGANFTGINNLSTSNGGTTQLTGALTTSGIQTYDDAVSLTGATTLTSSGNQAITFNNTVNGSQDLTVNTTGTSTFSGTVGDTAPLTSLMTNAGGTTAVNGASVATSGNQTYNDNVTMNQATTLTSTGGAITFGDNATNSAAGAGITVDAPTINLTGGTTIATTGNGPISFFTDTLNPNGASINAGTGAFALAPNVLTRTIEFGDVNTGQVTDVYYGSNFAGVTAGSFTIGRSTHTGNIFVTGVAAAPSALNIVNGGTGSVTFENAPYLSGNQNLGVVSGSGGIDLGSNLTLGTGTLRLTTTGAITQTAGTITATTAGLSAATDINLAQPTNNVTTLAAQTTSGNILFADNNGFTVGSDAATPDGLHPAIVGLSAGAGNVTLQSGGPVTQTAAITANGLNLQGIGFYQLTNAGNDVTTLAANTTGAIDYQDANSLTVGTVGATNGITSGNNDVALQTGGALTINQALNTGTGNLGLSTNGPVTQAAAGTITANNLNLQGAGPYDLTNANNDVNVVGANTTGSVQVTDVNNLTVGAVTAVGSLPAVIGIISGNNDVALVTGGTLTFANSINAGTGNVGLQAGGAVTQGAASSIIGNNLNLQGNGPYTLTNGGNDVATLGGTTAGNVQYADANSLTLGAVPVVGSLPAAGGLTSTGGNITVTNTTGDLTLSSVSAQTGSVNLTATGGSILGGGGAGPHLTAGANSTLQAPAGVVGTQAAPINVLVNGGTLGILAGAQLAGISGFLTGTVVPSNALTLLLPLPPGLVCFNGCPVASSPVSDLATGLVRSTFGYLNPDTIVPAYYPQPSRSVLISDITSVYMPGTLLQPSPVSLSSGSPAVQSMGPKAKARTRCEQGATASFDTHCTVR